MAIDIYDSENIDGKNIYDEIYDDMNYKVKMAVEIKATGEIMEKTDDIKTECDRIEKKLNDLSGEIKRLKTYLYFIPMTLGAVVSGLIINPILNHMLK